MSDRDPTNCVTLDFASINDEQFESLIAAIFRAKISSPVTDRNATYLFGKEE